MKINLENWESLFDRELLEEFESRGISEERVIHLKSQIKSPLSYYNLRASAVTWDFSATNDKRVIKGVYAPRGYEEEFEILMDYWNKKIISMSDISYAKTRSVERIKRQLRGLDLQVPTSFSDFSKGINEYGLFERLVGYINGVGVVFEVSRSRYVIPEERIEKICHTD